MAKWLKRVLALCRVESMSSRGRLVKNIESKVELRPADLGLDIASDIAFHLWLFWLQTLVEIDSESCKRSCCSRPYAAPSSTYLQSIIPDFLPKVIMLACLTGIGHESCPGTGRARSKSQIEIAKPVRFLDLDIRAAYTATTTPKEHRKPGTPTRFEQDTHRLHWPGHA